MVVQRILCSELCKGRSTVDDILRGDWRAGERFVSKTCKAHRHVRRKSRNVFKQGQGICWIGLHIFFIIVQLLLAILCSSVAFAWTAKLNRVPPWITPITLRSPVWREEWMVGEGSSRPLAAWSHPYEKEQSNWSLMAERSYWKWNTVDVSVLCKWSSWIGP